MSADLAPGRMLPNANRRLYVVMDGEDEDDHDVIGVYSTPERADEAMKGRAMATVWEFELDRLPDEPEGHREPDYGAPSAQERSELDYEEKQQLDRGYKDVGREYDKYEHEEFRS